MNAALMGTSLSYTPHINEANESKSINRFHVVAGMPRHGAYEADRGWENLLAPPEPKARPRERLRDGGSRRDQLPLDRG